MHFELKKSGNKVNYNYRLKVNSDNRISGLFWRDPLSSKKTRSGRALRSRFFLSHKKWG